MHPDELLEAIRIESAAMAAVAETGLDRPVPACPGWNVRQLMNHLGRVHRWVTTMVAGGATERIDFPPRPEVVDAGWFLSGAEALVTTLEEAGPDLPVWTMAKGHDTSRFWIRRQAVETAVHRWDAEQAVGEPGPIETELALAGVDEALDVFLTPRTGDLGGSVHFHATDSPHGEWIVRDDPDGGLMIGHGHEKGDVALRGAAGDLLLWLWGRDVPADRFETFGDGTVLERWRANLALG